MTINLVLQTSRSVAGNWSRPLARLRCRAAMFLVLATYLAAAPAAHAQEQPAAQPTLGTIEGRTTLKSTGEPVADADVRLVNRNQSTIPLKMMPTRSDAEGKFVFRDVPPGKYRLVAFHNRLASRVKMFQGLELTVDKQGQASESPVLQLEPVNSIRVHVDSQVTGQPLAKARVRLTWTDTDRDHFTDEEGNVEIHGLTPDPWTIEVTAAGHAEEERRLTLTLDQLLNEARVSLVAGGVVKGRVVDAAGQPLKRVGVSARSESFQGGQIEYVETDADGRYAFDYLPLIPLQLYFSKDDFLPQRKDVALSAAQAARTLDVQLEARPYGGGVLVGVANAESEPIAKATIKNHGNSSSHVREGTTNDEGLCLMEDVFQSSSGYELVVRAAGYAPQAVTCKPGPKDAPTQLAVILERGHKIKGRVVLADTDQPAAGVRVYFAGGESGIGGIGDRVDTDKEGRFTSDSLPSPCTFTFYPLPGYSQIDDLDLALDGEEEVVIRMERAAAIRGRVVDAATGEPVTHFTVKLGFCQQREANDPAVGGITSDLVDPGSEFTGKSGDFEVGSFTHLAPFQVTIDAPGYERTVLKRVVATRAEEEAPVIKLARPDPKSQVEVGGMIRLEGRALTGVQVRLIVSAELPRKKK